MAEKKEGIMDPENYRKVSEPFESPDEAQKALEGFWDEFYALRNKWGIPDAYCVMRVTIMYEDGEGEVITRMHAGNSTMSEPLAAWAYGYEQAEREKAIADLVSKAGKSARAFKPKK